MFFTSYIKYITYKDNKNCEIFKIYSFLFYRFISFSHLSFNLNNRYIEIIYKIEQTICIL